MKLLADVNVAKEIVTALRTDGHAVRWLAEDRVERRLADAVLMRQAYGRGEVILTNDREFRGTSSTTASPRTALCCCGWRSGVSPTRGGWSSPSPPSARGRRA